MSWSEIKKAVNSDLSTPLNEQIAEIGFEKYASANYSYYDANTTSIIDNIQKNGLLFLYPLTNTMLYINGTRLGSSNITSNAMFIMAFSPTDNIVIKGKAGGYTATGFYSILTEK